MNKEEAMRDLLIARKVAHEIHEVTYLKHVTGATEDHVRMAMSKVGNNRSKVERELRRQRLHAVRDSAA